LAVLLFDEDGSPTDYFYDLRDEDMLEKLGLTPEALNALKKYRPSITAYKTGGLADFTGPAWLDGTPSKPEYILNADQTARFFELIDVLGNIKPTSGETSHSDSYFDIDIHVDKLDNDYDVEQMANKIRSMIYEDATYRNVNAINQIR
jgi:hypothetical protein